MVLLQNWLAGTQDLDTGYNYIEIPEEVHDHYIYDNDRSADDVHESSKQESIS